MSEEKKEKKKKKKLKWKIKLLLIIILIVLYAFFIGTKGIFIQEYSIKTNKIENKMHGFKIIQISDIHYGSSVNNKMIEKMVNKINETKPDIVIFTGDLIDKRKKISKEDKEFLKKELSNINAEIGKYYITGEEDNDEAKNILNLSNFNYLDNNEQAIYKNSLIPIYLITKDSITSFFENNDNQSFNLLILHNPDDINPYKKLNIDASIAGHTHNGGINIPKIKDYLIKSKYKKNYQKVNNIKLYINPGIGTSKINVRLFNHPTINLYRLNKAS